MIIPTKYKILVLTTMELGWLLECLAHCVAVGLVTKTDKRDWLIAASSLQRQQEILTSLLEVKGD
jgi:hypothetical protein